MPRMDIPGYQILKPIGVGGMATAYLAVQTSLGRQVVLKVMDTGDHTTDENIERFINEGRLIASLNHPNIVTIFDIGRTNKLVYLSMEYVEGGDLKSRISHILTPADALDIVKKIASALDCAHKNGVIHRDVKPANILFRKDGTPLLSDFGIAKKLTVDHDLTATGIFLGSPNYMAPEQADTGPIDGRADIYSLGVIFYEMLTGNKPYQAESVIDIIVQHKRAPIPTLPSGLEALQPLLNLMMAKKRRDRFHDAESMLHYIRDMERQGVIKTGTELIHKPDFDLSGGFSQDGVAVKSTTPETPPPRSHRRTHNVLFGLLILAALAFSAVQFYARLLNREYERPPEQPPQELMVQAAPAEVPAPAAKAGAGATATPAPHSEEVRRALVWLAQKSLDDYRLTSPPNDNAYYYYSRLQTMNPNDPVVAEGFKAIAQRFAQLAEREIARNDVAQARSYITIGLQLDPANPSLNQLQALAKPAPHGFLETLLSLFRPAPGSAQGRPGGSE